MLPLLILLLWHISIEDASSREEQVIIKDKEKLKNDKCSQLCQLFDSDFMHKAFEIYGTCSEKFEDF